MAMTALPPRVAIILSIVALTLHGTSAGAPTTQAPLVTKGITLESWNWNYYARSWAHLGSVQSMVLVQEHNYVQAHDSPLCHQEGDNATFGFYGATTWVKDGCRGDFTVTLDTQDTAAAKYAKLVAKFQGLIDETHLLESTVESQSSMIAELTSMVDELENPSSAASTAAPTTEKVLTWRDVICPASGYTVVHDLSKDCSGYVTCSQGVATHTPCWENAFFDPVGWTCKGDPALSCL